jgi:hypothetical protein
LDIFFIFALPKIGLMHLMRTVMSTEESGNFIQKIHQIGDLLVISTSGELFNHYDTDGEMWTQSGDRSIRVSFEFKQSFNDVPSVIVGVIGIDQDSTRNLRYGVSVENISKASFEVVFVTWNDTRIARASISWQALGAVQISALPNRPRIKSQ